MSDEQQLEAVQYDEWSVWHAVRLDNENRTYCGCSALSAKSMWERWEDHAYRCRKCEASLAKLAKKKKKKKKKVIT